MKRLTLGDVIGLVVAAGCLGASVAALGVATAMSLGAYPWR